MSTQSILFRKVQHLKNLLLSLPQNSMETISMDCFAKYYARVDDHYVGPLSKIDIALSESNWETITQSQYALAYMKIILSIEHAIHHCYPLSIVMENTLQKIQKELPCLFNMSIWSYSSFFSCRNAIHNPEKAINLSYPFREFVLENVLQNNQHALWFYQHKITKCGVPIYHQRKIIGAFYAEVDAKEAPHLLSFLNIIAELFSDLLIPTTKTQTAPTVSERMTIQEEVTKISQKIPQVKPKTQKQKEIQTQPLQVIADSPLDISVEAKSSTRRKSLIPDRSIIKSTMQNKGAVLSEDVKSDYGDMSLSIVSQSVDKTISTPILKDDEVLGIIYLDESRYSFGFSKDDLTLANAVAAKISQFLTQVYQKRSTHNQVSLRDLKSTAVHVLRVLHNMENKEIPKQQLDKIIDEMSLKSCQNTYWSTIWKISYFLVSTSNHSQKILDNLERHYSKISPPFFERWLGDEALRPGPIERLVAQSAKLKKWIQATLGLKFIAIAHAIDTLIEFFSSVVKNIFQAWKFAKSVRRHIERQRSGKLVEAMVNDWQQNRQLLSRYFSLSGFSARDAKATFALELALDIRHHLDENIRDLNLLTTSQRAQTAKKSLVDFISGFIPNPFEIFSAWKDILIVVFFMKYRREDVENMYWQMLNSGRQMIVFLDEKQNFDLELQHYERELKWRMAPQKEYENLEQCINANRDHLQRLLQAMVCSQIITPQRWLLEDVIREVKLGRGNGDLHHLCDIELEKRILAALKPRLKTNESQELQRQLHDNRLFRNRYKAIHKAASKFL